MGETMSCTGAGALLQSTQQLRTHWSGVITTRIGYGIVALVAIWSYFLKVYIDSFAAKSGAQPLYILLATVLSTILFVLWNRDTRNFVYQINLLYADFILSERVLSIPPEYGTSGYLMRVVSKNLGIILKHKDLTPEQGAKGILMLSERERLGGGRGFSKINKFIARILSVMWWVSAIIILLQNELVLCIAILCFILIIIPVVLIWFVWRTSWKIPSEKDVEDIPSKLKGNRGTDT